MKNILFIDTSTSYCIIEIIRETIKEKIKCYYSLFSKVFCIPQNQDNWLYKCMNEIFQQYTVSTCYIGRGPGSFTGLRIVGVYFKIICILYKIPLCSFCSISFWFHFWQLNSNTFFLLRLNNHTFFYTICPPSPSNLLSIKKVRETTIPELISNNKNQQFAIWNNSFQNLQAKHQKLYLEKYNFVNIRSLNLSKNYNNIPIFSNILQKNSEYLQIKKETWENFSPQI